MNVQAHMSGHFSGQVSQASNQLPGLPQMNGNSFHPQMQNLSGQSNPSMMDAEVVRIRKFMTERIFRILLKKQTPPTEMFARRCQDLSRRLEEGLFRSAASKEAYMNLNTLELRLHALVKRPASTNHVPQHSQFLNTSTPVGTMIPTPGLHHNGNSSVITSTTVDPTMITASTGGSTSTSIPTAGGLMPTVNGSFSGMRGGSFRSAEGTFSNGYQQSASSFPTGVGNVMVGQRPVSQMIPTPGYSGSNNQTLTNTENSNNGVTFSSVDSSVVSQKISQKVPQRYASDQNGQMSQNLGNGMRSLHQQQFQNDTSNSGFGNAFGASTRSLLQPNDQHHQPAVQGDSSGSGDLYNTGTSVGSLVNNQNGNQVRTSSTSRPSSLMTSQSTTQSTPSGSYIRPHVAEHAEKSKFQSSTSTRENHSQSSMGQFQQQPHQVPQQQHFTSHRQQRQSTELSQASVRNRGFQSQSMFGVGSLVKRENGLEGQSDDFQPQNSDAQIQVAELESQHQYNSNGNLPRNPQSYSFPSATHSTHLSNPQPMMVDEKANGFDGLSVGAQPDALLHRSWQSDADRLRMAAKLSDEQLVQEEFQQRIVGHEEAQRIHFSSEVPSNGQIVASGSIMNQHQSGGAVGSLNDHRNRHYRNQLRWLLFLYHARWCKAPAGKCPERNCITVQQLLRHMDNCNAVNCLHPRCALTRRLLAHNKHCRDMNCPVCIPYRKFIQAQKALCAHQDSIRLETLKSFEAGEAKAKETIRPLQPVIESSENQPSVKRLKSEQPSQSLTSGNGIMSVRNAVTASHVPNNVRSNEYEKYDTHNNLLVKYEHPDMKAEISSSSNQKSTEIKNAANDISSGHELDGGSVLKDINSSRNDEAVKLEKDNGQSKTKDVVVPSEQGPVLKSGKPMIKGVSLIELFTPEQVREHITGLRQWVGQSKAKVEKIQALEQTMNENSCQLCAVEKLSFEPPPLYCTPCGARIKRNAMYYTAGAGDTRHYFCIPCYNEARGDVIQVDGKPMSKSRMAKRKNDEEMEEGWVQCDRCEAWQHQICALFNGKRNDGGQADYTCPNCYLEEVERGERQPLPQSTVLGAKDLPGTALSDHIEQRLAKRLKQERQERARSQGKSFDEVPGVEGVVVRVVSSVDKKLEVKPRFLEIFREENYPLEFPYKSKVVLLFQKIEGVEVCLYGMYVQEFGSECLPPNQRRVYLSYLDSVKYFRPDVKAVTGEALRTFVYHEILIGYLEYCKKRGFASCYIWACPPLKGEDYILYCHPEIQKTPKSDKLREWYLAMLRKASRENIVVELTNLYDHFFTQSGECKAKVTAARLPYFDGDYWPGAAEDMINMIYQEEECRKLNKKGATKKIITKRALKASGQLDLSTNASKDVLLMLKLGETIAPMKEDFIMVHLQHACTHCCMLMVSGNRWVCELCKRFQLCDRCYDEETKRDDRDRHPINQKDKHVLKKIEITDVPEDTKDEDEILESEFFDTRQAFLSLCQGNHYQYDTLRRAKHSSMMMLYHLHNPTAPAFVTTCNICHLDIETGQGWRCETCPEYDVCNSCYQKDGGTGHPHKLTHHPSIAERDAQNKEARQQRVVQLRKMLDLLVHASQCRIPPCQYPNCQKVKSLFRHGIQCQLRAFRGCSLCKRMWYLLQLHARACKESACHVPRCKDLREHLRRLQQQSDSRRRTAVMEMMRQRAKEVSGNA